MRILAPTSRESIDLRQLAEVYAWPEPARRSLPSPWVRVNFATSVDGSIAGPGAKSQTVSGSADKLVFALLRATSDAVLVGAGTARAEGYGAVKVRASMREIRAAQGLPGEPGLVVVTKSGNLDPTADMFSANPRTIVATCASADPSKVKQLRRVAEVISCGSQFVDLPALLSELADREIARVLCEGGPRLFNDLLATGVVDDLCLTISPLLVGGLVPDTNGFPINPGRITAARDVVIDPQRLNLASVLKSDGALLTRWLVDRPAPAP